VDLDAGRIHEVIPALRSEKPHRKKMINGYLNDRESETLQAYLRLVRQEVTPAARRTALVWAILYQRVEKSLGVFAEAAAKMVSKPITQHQVIQYTVTQNNFERALDELDILISNADHTSTIVVATVGLDAAQFDLLNESIPAANNNRPRVCLVVVTDKMKTRGGVYFSDAVLATARDENADLEDIDLLLKQKSDIRFVVISNGIPFVASATLAKFMMLYMVIGGAWKLIDVQQNIDVIRKSSQMA
jgi:hypothetical protein